MILLLYSRVMDADGTTPYVTNALNQYTSANGTYYQYDTSGNMIYDGHYVFDYDPENRLNKVKRFEQGPTAMALACDTTLTFTSGGSANWFTQTQEHYFEGDAAQSGDIGDSQQSWMQATVSGTGYISFYWKVSSDGGDCRGHDRHCGGRFGTHRTMERLPSIQFSP